MVVKQALAYRAFQEMVSFYGNLRDTCKPSDAAPGVQRFKARRSAEKARKVQGNTKFRLLKAIFRTYGEP